MQYTNFNQILCTGEWSESGQCMIRGGFFFFSFLHQSFPGTGNTYTYFLLTFLKYSRSLLYSDSTTAQKISWNGWPDLQVTDIIIIVVIYNSRQMWRGPYRYIYDQRRYRVSFYLAATMRLSRAGPGSDLRHEWHKLKHQVPPRGGHFEKKTTAIHVHHHMSMHKKWQGSFWRGKETLGVRVQLLWCKCRGGTGAWFHMKTDKTAEWRLPYTLPNTDWKGT